MESWVLGAFVQWLNGTVEGRVGWDLADGAGEYGGGSGHDNETCDRQ